MWEDSSPLTCVILGLNDGEIRANVATEFLATTRPNCVLSLFFFFFLLVPQFFSSSRWGLNDFIVLITGSKCVRSSCFSNDG